MGRLGLPGFLGSWVKSWNDTPQKGLHDVQKNSNTLDSYAYRLLGMATLLPTISHSS